MTKIMAKTIEAVHTHTHTCSFIKQNKGLRAFVYHIVKGRLFHKNSLSFCVQN